MVRKICWGNFKKEKQENHSQMRNLLKAPHSGLLLPYSEGPLASSNCITLTGSAMVKSV